MACATAAQRGTVRQRTDAPPSGAQARPLSSGPCHGGACAHRPAAEAPGRRAAQAPNPATLAFSSRSMTMSKRDTYVAKMKLQLDELNLKLTALSARDHDARRDARTTYDDEMDKLRNDAHAATVKFDELKAVGEVGWHKLVGEMENRRAAFSHAFTRLKSQP
jgi:hypothetical protein